MANPRPSAEQAPRMLMGPPETPSRVMQASPNMFPTLQFSPDIFSPAFGSISAPGSASAPLYPQQRLFWDPNTTIPNNAPATVPVAIDHNPNHQSTPFSPYQQHDPFQQAATPPNHHFNHSFGSASTIVSPFITPVHHLPPQRQQSYEQSQLQFQHQLQHQPVDSRPPSTYLPGPAFAGPFSTSPRMPLPQDDNPSMFLSSPARRFTNDPQPVTTIGTFVPERPAYYHQIEESKREKEAKRRRKNEARHPSVTRSVMEALRRPISPVKDKAIRPGLKRSLTHSGAHGRQNNLLQPQPQQQQQQQQRLHQQEHQQEHQQHQHQQPQHQTHVSFLDNISTHSGSTTRSGRTGRSSPLKSLIGSLSRQQIGSKASKRTSLSLEIDENGVAKTVVTKLSDDLSLDIDEEDEDDDDSGSESCTSSRDESDFGLLVSQPNSFRFPNNDDGDDNSISQTPTVAGRLHAQSKHGSNSSMASHGSTAPSLRNGSAFLSPANSKLPKRASAQRKAPSLFTMQEDIDLTPPVSASGDAQQALRAIIQDRSRSASAHDVGSGGSQHSAQFNSSPPIPHHSYSNYNVSPTTITDPGLATPSTEHESPIGGGSGGTRCVCNNPEPTTLMIQCDSCTNWLHSMCVGIHDQRLPEAYVCIYCSQTPVRPRRRRGRVGGHPAPRSPLPIAQSPLAHKSGPPRW